MNIVRMYIAVVITMLAIPYIKEKRWLPVLIITGVACSFHVSAIIIIPLFVFYCMKLTPRKGLVILILFAAGISIIYPIVRWFAMNISGFTDKGYYFNNSSSTSIINADWTELLIFSSFFLVLSLMYKEVKGSKNLQLLYSASLVGLIVAVSTFVLPGTFIRTALYMNPIFSLFIPEMIENFPYKKYKLLLKYAIIILYSAVCIWVVFFQKSRYLPYRFLWS